MLLKFEELDGKTILVSQVKSELGYAEDQKQTWKALGLKGVNTTSELKCTKSVYGMLNKVKHLIDIKIK